MFICTTYARIKKDYCLVEQFGGCTEDRNDVVSRALNFASVFTDENEAQGKCCDKGHLYGLESK